MHVTPSLIRRLSPLHPSIKTCAPGDLREETADGIHAAVVILASRKDKMSRPSWPPCQGSASLLCYCLPRVDLCRAAYLIVWATQGSVELSPTLPPNKKLPWKTSARFTSWSMARLLLSRPLTALLLRSLSDMRHLPSFLASLCPPHFATPVGFLLQVV